jgi:arylsulfatase A-like enzyme
MSLATEPRAALEPIDSPASEAGPRAGAADLHASPSAVLQLAAWAGLATGNLELISMLVKCNLTDPRYYNVSRHYLWMYPLASLMVCGAPGVLLALFARLWPGRLAMPVAAGGIAFVGGLSLLLRWPIYTAACVLLAAGLALQAARFAAAHPMGVRRLAGRGLVVLGVLFGASVAFSYGRIALAERRALANLPPAPRGARNVLLIVLDTVRAESLSLYGYGRDTTPNLVRLAGKGVRFDRALATAPWTTPSHASMFTGQWAHDLSAGWKRPLDDTYPTLAEYLRDHGYATAGFVANTYYCSYETGLDRGFAHYEDYDVTVRKVLLCSSLVQRVLTVARARLGLWGLFDDVRQANVNRKGAATINDEFLGWLSGQGRGRPFFAFLNYYDAHHPYLPPEPPERPFGLRPETRDDYVMLRQWWDADKRKLSPRDVALARDAYDECIAYLDRQLGRLFDELERRGVLEETLVIVTSDHGEHVGEQDLFGHGCSLYRPELHVPLLVIDTSGTPAGRIVRAPVSLRDLPATVVDRLGMAQGSPFPGRSLARHWDGAAESVAETPDLVISEVEAPPEADPNRGRSPAGRGPMRSLVWGGMHYIRNGDGREELYDFEADPAEEHDLGASAAARPALDRSRAALERALAQDRPRAAGGD